MATSQKIEANGAWGAASDWLNVRAAFASRTCAVASRRGLGEAGAPGFRAGLLRTGLERAVPGRPTLCFPGKGSGGARGPSAARD